MNTFEFEGQTYLKNPTILELLSEAGLDDENIIRVATVFERLSISRLFHLQTITQGQMEKMLNGNKKITNDIFSHLQLIKHQGRIIKTGDELNDIEKHYNYLLTPSTSLDMMLTYSNAESGFRTQSVIEIYGPAGVGKTQWAMTQAIIAMKEWDCSVGYIDSEGAFEYSRFNSLGKYYDVNVNSRIFVSNVNNFDELEHSLDKFEEIIIDKNIRILIIDSIIDPLKTQYPIAGEDLANLQPRQRHLKTVVDKLKTLAKMYNMIILYTNQIRADFEKGITPQGGNVLSHASDIRIELKEQEQNEQFELLGLKLCKATVVDCGFLPNLSGEYIVSPMGIMDPIEIKSITKHTQLINKTGYICINQDGDLIEKSI